MPIVDPDEGHYRLHLTFTRRFGEAGVAIDLFIGQVIDKQIEIVISKTANDHLRQGRPGSIGNSLKR